MMRKQCLTMPCTIAHLLLAYLIMTFSEANPNEKITTWMLANGATFPTIKTVSFSEGYRGIVAEKNLVDEETVMTIPLHLLITDLNALNGSTLAKQIHHHFLDEVKDEDIGHIYITLYLLENMLGFNSSETGKHFFQPWFDILPQSLEAFGGIPATWSQEDLKLLKGTSTAYDDAVLYKNNCIHQYILFSSKIAGFAASYSFDQYLWASLVVESRVYLFTFGNDDDERLVMAPYGDMMNHDNLYNTNYHIDPSSNSYILYANQDILSGNQICINYGENSNSDFLLHYGFTLEDNSNAIRSFNMMLLQIPMGPFDPDVENYYSRDVDLSMEYDDNGYMYSYLRFIATAESGLLPTNKNDPIYNFEERYVDAISWENEKSVMKHLANVCKSYLENFSTTLEHDIKALSNLTAYPMGSNRRNAANILKGEKEILHYYMAFTENNLALLEMSWDSFTVATTAAPQSSYVTTVMSKLIREKTVPSFYVSSKILTVGILAGMIVAILLRTMWFKHPTKMYKKKNSCEKVKCS